MTHPEPDLVSHPAPDAVIRLLIADDHPVVRDGLSSMFAREAGFEVLGEAADGAEGLQLMRTHQIDIIMTDLAMQPPDGIDFVRLLRNSADSPNPMAPVIMITGHSTHKRVNEARDVGVTEFLSKPVTAKGVLERIGRVVDNPRPFVRTNTYFGPDRRRKADPSYTGPMRRSTDEPKE